MASHQIKLFALSTCSHCKAAEKQLKRYHHRVEIVEVDRLGKDNREAAIKEVKQYNERVSFPTTVIGGEVVVGYKADRIKKVIQEIESRDGSVSQTHETRITKGYKPM